MLSGSISPENQQKLERFAQFTHGKHTTMQRMIVLLQASALFLQIMDQALGNWPCEKPEDCPAFALAVEQAGKEALAQIEQLVNTAFPPDAAGYHESFLDILQSLIWDSGHLADITAGRLSLLQHVQRNVTATLAQKAI